MPTDQRPLKVFLSYASQDKTAVLEIYSALKRESWIDPWLDKERILPGQDWQMVIETAVDEADVVIICLSNQSVSKEGYVQREIKYAYDIALEKPEGTIFLIPLRLDECEIPRKLRFLHRVDYFGVEKDNSYSHLLDALNVRYNQKLRSEDDHRARQERERTESKVAESTAMPKEEEKAQEVIKDQKLRKLLHLPKSIEVNIRIIFFFIIGVIILRFFVPDFIAAFRGETPTPVPIRTPTATITLTLQPISASGTPELGQTPTEIFALTFTPVVFNDPHPDSSDHVDSYGIPMRLVPAGEFAMGSEDGDSDERPVHTVYLDDFYIDKYEVTNAFYKACVDAGVCQPPQNASSFTLHDFYGKPEYDNYPVMSMSWNTAKIYCEWRGAQLPTEAQWEKAARGTDERTYPWGEEIDQTFAKYDQSGGPSIVGSYEIGKSPYGVYDMAGNVAEWVEDWYSQTFYANSPISNPSGPGSALYRVHRGGTWYDSKEKVRTSDRSFYKPDEILDGFGFRCARGTSP